MVRKSELKLKARVANFAATAKTVSKFARFVKNSEFVDTFFQSNTKKVYELRIRKGISRNHVTMKVFIRNNSVQQNAIYEFTDSTPEEFVSFLELLDLKPVALLRKKSKLYAYGRITIELTDVERLGKYIELILPSKEENFERDTAALHELAAKLGIEKESIDLRFYGRILSQS